MEKKQLTSADGTIAHYVKINGKQMLHNWDAAAFIPQGNMKKAEYYLFGIKHSKAEWEEKKKDVNGIPFHKTAAGKAGLRG
jgi:hypothetical protein